MRCHVVEEQAHEELLEEVVSLYEHGHQVVRAVQWRHQHRVYRLNHAVTTDNVVVRRGVHQRLVVQE